jgi:hypothetical protein
MLAKRLTTSLPPLTLEESLETTKPDEEELLALRG